MDGQVIRFSPRFLRVLGVSAASALLVLAALALHAQPVPKFEVVSIKPCAATAEPAGRKGGGIGRTGGSPGRLTVECQTVDDLVRGAYLRYPDGKPWPISPTIGMPEEPISRRLLNQDIKGSSGWIASERFTIDARPETPVAREMMLGPMMQALLQERFKLKLHKETREIPVFELTVAKTGPKLPTAAPGACKPIEDLDSPPPPLKPGQARPPAPCGAVSKSPDGYGLDIHGITMADLARQFSTSTDRDVVDKTGLTGLYDIHLELTFPDLGYPEPGVHAPFSPTDGTALSFAVQKLGLKLEPAKSTAGFLVIDHVERPTGN